MSEQEPKPTSRKEKLLNILYLVIYFIILFGLIWVQLWAKRKI